MAAPDVVSETELAEVAAEIEGNAKIQQDKIKELRERLQANKDVMEKLTKGGEFQEGEEPLSDIYLKRWLKASSWHVDGVESFIVKHASWRYDMCPNGRIKESEIPKEIAANKLFLQGTDKSGRGLSIMLAGKHDAWYADRNEVLRMLCYSFDAQIDMADVSTNPDRKICCMFDLTNAGIFNLDISTPNAVYDLLANHFVGRFGTVIIYNAPTIFWATWTAFKTVLSEDILKFIKFVYPNDKSPLHEVVDPKVLPKEYDGDSEYIPIQNAVAKMRIGN